MDRFTWAIVLSVLALIVAGVVAAAVLQAREASPDLASPAGVAVAYAQAVRDGDGDRAWSLLAAGAQAGTTRERFLLRVATMAERNGRVRLAVEGERVDGDTAHVDLVRTYTSTGDGLGLFGGPSPQRSPVTLVREGGQWRIVVPPDPFVIQS